MQVRRILGPLLVVGSLIGAGTQAQFGVAWRHAPNIIVVSAAGDARVGLVEEGAAFWNRTLAELGSPFRLAPARHVVQVLPEEALQSLSGLVVGGPGVVSIPQALRDPPGDITVFLSRSEFVSFTGPFDPSGRRVIGIRGAKFPPMDLPNVPLNVITHELGHALGLGHNSDPTKLMCGRPAPCRPALFRSEAPHIFPLTDEEKQKLRTMYPAQWKPG
jgi:hypothetical protein